MQDMILGMQQEQDESSLAELAALLFETGDKIAYEKLWRHYLKLAHNVSRRYWVETLDKKEDVEGVALATIFQVLERVRTKKLCPEGSICGYMARAMFWEVFRFLSNDHMIPIPRTTVVRNHITEFPMVGELDDGITFNKDIAASDPQFELMKNDFYTFFALNPIQCKILDLKIQGYTVEEIGGVLDMTKQNVSLILNFVRRKVSKHYA
jgi:hypothetical protein